MQKNFLFGIGGLVIGLAIGFFVANSINRSSNVPQASAQNQPSNPLINQTAPQNAPGAMMPDIAATLDKAKSEPQNFEAQIKAGEMYAQIGRFETALEFYERAAKIKPEDIETQVKTANAYFDAKQFETAEKWYLKALEKKEDANVRTDLGITFVERENPDLERAIREFETALQTSPRNETILYNLAVAYARKGDADNAAKVKQQLEEINPQSELAARLRKVFATN